jgi:serine/threonine protein kinase
MPPVSRATIRAGGPSSSRRPADAASAAAPPPRRTEATLPPRPSCPSEDELAGFVDGSLSAAERLWLETHLDECPLCRAALGHLAALDAPGGPRTVARYRLDAELGRGGMGVVWRAWDPALEREVAVKLLHPELVDDLRFRQRALREARALARLQHPNVIAVHDVGEADGELFIATELIDGLPLDRWQRDQPIRHLLSAYAQAARGLAAAHALGLVHRDVKPSNILVSRSGRACIGDFGLATSARPRPGGAAPLLPGQRAEPAAALAAARHAEPPAAAGSPPLPRLTDEGMVLGTPAYMAPEQPRGEPVDAAADQYALCMALAEALLGYRPRDGVTAEELAQSGLPAPWPAIARGLAHHPADRFPDLDPLIAALEASAAPPPPPSWLSAPALPPASPPLAMPPPVPAGARRSLLPAAAAAAFVAAAFVAGSAILFATRLVPATRSAPASDAASPTADVAPPPRPPRTTPSGEPLPTSTTPLPAAWRASQGGAWRLPTRGRDVVILDQRRAAVMPWADAERSRLMTVDLDTGAVTPPAPLVPLGATIDAVRRVAGRAVAFGSVGELGAAWELAGTPLTAWRLEVPQAGRSVDPHRAPAVVVSPDGTQLLWCDPRTAPTVRDGITLAILHELPASSCADAHFTSAHELALGEVVLDLRTGRRRPGHQAKRAPDAHHAGPGGHVLVCLHGSRIADVVGPNGEPTQASLLVEDRLRWTPDGVAISLTEKGLGLRPTNAYEDRVLPLGRLPSADDTFDVDAERAVVLSGALVEVIDLRSGARRGAAANRDRVHAVAPYRGTVLALSDQLRLFAEEGPLTSDVRRGDAVRAVPELGQFAMRGDDGALWLWDPTDHSRRQLTSGLPSDRWTVAARGDRVWFGAEATVVRSVGGEPAQPWLPLRQGLVVVALEPEGRVAALEGEHLHLIDLEAGAVQTWRRSGDCLRQPAVALGGGRLALVAAGHAVLVESDGIAYHLEVPGPIDQLALTSDGAVVVAHGGEVLFWPRGQRNASAWPTGIPAGARVTALGLDERGEELALGYDTGAVVYAPVAELRGRGSARPLPVALEEHCLRRVTPPPIATLVGI